MKTKNTRVRLRDIKQGVTVYVANAISKSVTEHFITSRPYVEKHTKSEFVQSKKCYPGDNRYTVYECSDLDEFSLRDAGIINNAYNKNLTFFKRKHAEEHLRKAAYK